MRPLTLLAALFALGTWSANADARRIVCIDDDNDIYNNNHEGYERARPPAAGDTIVRVAGGNLTTCLALLKDGDELVIVTHGCVQGEGFWWNGVSYFGFGNGDPNNMPVPAMFDTLRNITVRFDACWTALDPPLSNPDTTLIAKLMAAMGGATRGHSIMGFTGVAWCDVRPRVTGGNDSLKALARACLLNTTAWVLNPPVNRPGTGGSGEPANQLTAAQAQVDACLGMPGLVTVVLESKISNGTSVGYTIPENRAPQESPPSSVLGTPCDSPICPDGCGCGDVAVIVTPDPPTPGVPGSGRSLLLALGGLLLAAGGVAVRLRAGRAA